MDFLTNKIQDSELEVMRVLWETNQATSLIRIRQDLHERCGWADSTVKTLLQRLCKKGAVALERRGMYCPVLDASEYYRWSTRQYVDKVFGGDVKKMVSFLIADGLLSGGDIMDISVASLEKSNDLPLMGEFTKVSL